MNRRQKIIVSVTGIFLVLLILVGLTYAYFLTRIDGNDAEKSISVTTADLAVDYSDDTNELITSANPIVPGEFNVSKTFTATNNGNSAAEYVVVLEDMEITYAQTTTDVTAGTTTSFVYPEDFRYALTCTVKDKNGNAVSGKSCNGMGETGFPINGGVLVGNNIEQNHVHEYVLTMEYVDTGRDQSVDMNKHIEGLINIRDVREVNPYSSNTTHLANKIINNALNVTDEEKSLGYAEFRTIPLTIPAVQKNLDTESELSLTTDELGTTYYYRGNVKNNYLNFNDMCWRIVRIEGDGSIKLILEDQYDTCEQIETDTDGDDKEYTGDWAIATEEYGYTKNANNQEYANYENYSGGIKDKLSTWLSTQFSETNQNMLKSTKICLGDWNSAYSNGVLISDIEKDNIQGYDYKTFVRLYGTTPYSTYLCDATGKSENEYKIYLLTADEAIYAGGKTGANSNYNYYLINAFYLNGDGYVIPTLSPYGFFDYVGYGDHPFLIYTDGSIDADRSVSNGFDVRPSISIDSQYALYDSGNGSQTNPYTLK